MDIDLDPDLAWNALTERDRTFDGRFVWAVRTTGIYCRPSCPARRPLRRNVTFYAAPDDAERAGYRPCKRCTPQSIDGTSADRMVQGALAYIDAHLDETITLARLSEHVGVSGCHLQRTFKSRVGLSPRAWQDGRRLERARECLQNGHTVEHATYEAGFNSSRAIYERTSERLGMTPGAVRRGGAGLAIRFTIAQSKFGPVLVAATQRGVCAVALASDDATSECALRKQFPRADLARDDRALRPWVESVMRYLDGVQPGLAVPVDLQGTAFQLRVWRALQEIPFGETRSYREVAEVIGAPRAVRAVASACAQNKAALVVPCHRVVHSNGSLSGYRWGVDVKRRLLDHERATGGGPVPPVSSRNPAEEQVPQ